MGFVAQDNFLRIALNFTQRSRMWWDPRLKVALFNDQLTHWLNSSQQSPGLMSVFEKQKILNMYYTIK